MVTTPPKADQPVAEKLKFSFTICKEVVNNA